MAKKHNYKTGLSVIAAILVLGVLVVGVFKLSGSYLGHTSARGNSGCSGDYHDHRVVIQNNKVTPEHTDAPRCDTLTIINKDSTDRLIAFGLHDDHVPYDGVSERLLGRNQNLTITLVSTGSYRFHDHLEDAVQGTFTVSPKN